MQHQQTIASGMQVRKSTPPSEQAHLLAIPSGTQVLLAYKDPVHLLPASHFRLEFARLLNRKDLQRTLLVAYSDELRRVEDTFGDIEQLGWHCAIDDRISKFMYSFILLHDGNGGYGAYEYGPESSRVELRKPDAEILWNAFSGWARDSLEMLES
jgi:hypothetical protein